MDRLAKLRIQTFGLWCGIAYLATVLIGFGAFAGFIPPTSPSADAGQIAELYHSDYTRIRIGMLVLMLAALVFIPFAATVAHFIARIEGTASVLTYTFLLGAAGNMVLTFYPAIWWLTAAYRPERGAELVYLINDTAWLQLVGGVTVFLAMPLSVVVASLSDKSAEPFFPRWCGYANGWISLTILPDQLLFFFHRGPFAWDGLFAFWIPIAAFGGFFVMNFVVLRRAIRRDRAHILESDNAQSMT